MTTDRSLNPKIHQAIQDLAHKHFAVDAESIEVLDGGFFSRAFAFSAASNGYVLRLNSEGHALESFAKDDYAERHFASPDLPIPKLIATGHTGGSYYALSERADGRMLSELTPVQRRRLLPELLDKLEAVGRADLRDSRGFGDWGADGDGKFTSWRGFLAAIIENHDDGYYGNWQRLYRESFLERDVYEAVYRRMLILAERCPEERALIHNDYQFENVISDGTKITAVIDWANALYGDPLYDVAWLGWISIHPGWWYDDGSKILRERFGSAPDYELRMACYSCHIGLDHLRFYAKNDRLEDYKICREWLLNLIENET